MVAEHYFSKTQSSTYDEKEISVFTLGIRTKLFSASGIFSKERLDHGSKLLIENAQLGKAVLDLGCGIGVIGIILKKANPKIDITFSDINERAVLITKKNLKRHKIKAKAIKSDGFEKIKEKFDTILLNPPQTAGKKVCFSLFEQSKEHLKRNGSLQIVMRSKKGAKSYKEKLREIFNTVEVVAKKKGFEIIKSS